MKVYSIFIFVCFFILAIEGSWLSKKAKQTGKIVKKVKKTVTKAGKDVEKGARKLSSTVEKTAKFVHNVKNIADPLNFVKPDKVVKVKEIAVTKAGKDVEKGARKLSATVEKTEKVVHNVKRNIADPLNFV